MNKPKTIANANAAPVSAVSANSTPVTQYLTKVLADTYVLGVKTHGAHWNVKGPGFFRLHAAFDEQYHELLLAADEIAERIRALDAMAPASMRQLLEHTGIGEPPTGDDMQLVRALRDDHRHVAKACRQATIVAEDADDEATADLLIGRSKAHDKTAWMLTATLGE
jgi:starvation-inducible DNA-binding protein